MRRELGVMFIAGLFEPVWALALKESHRFSKAGPTVLFVVTLLVSMVLLALASAICRCG